MKRFHWSVNFFFLLWMTAFMTNSFASYEKDPIKATQTKEVPVTKELLNREGEQGPASPSFKMESADRFLVKKPYEKVETGESGELEEETSHWWQDWFSLGKNKKNRNNSKR